jgi:hypothetical protein
VSHLKLQLLQLTTLSSLRRILGCQLFPLTSISLVGADSIHSHYSVLGVAPNKWQPFSINSGIPICSFRILVNIESDTDISNQPAISVQNPSSGHILHHVFLNTAPFQASNAHGIPSPGTSFGRWNKSWLLCFRTTKCSCIRWPALQL